jgi:hypothetical protein
LAEGKNLPQNDTRFSLKDGCGGFMEAAIRTLDKLRSLEQLYRQDFRSEVIDRTLDKLLAAEAELVLAERRDLETRLSAYEEQFNMSSQEFYLRFRAGELGDEVDFVEWNVFYEMHQAIRQRLDVLTGEISIERS